MPNPTPEQLQEKAAALKGALAKAGDTLEPEKIRALKKKIRRTQRRRRRILVAQAKATSGGKKKKKEE